MPQLPDTPFIRALMAQTDWQAPAAPAPNEQERQQAQPRINDEQSAGTRGTTPQLKPVRFPNMTMPGQMNYPLDPNRAPLEEAIRQEQEQYGRMSQPVKPTLKQRLMSALHGAAIGAPQVAENERQAATLHTGERENLANRIASQQTALAQEGIATERMKLQERMQEQATQRLLAELGIKGQQQMNLQGLKGQQQQSNIAERGGIQQGLLSTKLNEDWQKFQSTDQFRHWKDANDNQVKMRIAEINAGKAPATMLQTAEFAGGAMQSLQDAQTAMNDLQARGVMGTLPANWVENWLFGNGMVDPSLDPQTRQEIGQLKSALGYTSSAAMRAHTGRTSMEIYNDFKKMLGPGQDWNALRGAMQQTNEMMQQYYSAASNANIMRMRQGLPLQNPQQQPQQIPDGTRGLWRGRPVVRRNGQWVLAQ